MDRDPPADARVALDANAVKMNVSMQGTFRPVPSRFQLCRRRRQFSLRALFVFVALVSIALAWIQLGRQQRDAVAALQKSNPSVSIHYDYEVDSQGSFNFRATPRGFAWLRDWRWVDQFCTVTAVELSYATDADLECLAGLTHLRRLELQRAIDMTDKGMERLGKLTKLKVLRIFDADRITNAGLRHLERLSNLTELVLDVTPGRVTREAVERLQRALPQCRITARALLDGERDAVRIDSDLACSGSSMTHPRDGA